MKKRWGWLSAIAVLILVAVGVLWTPVGALLGGLVLLAWVAALTLAHGQVVDERNALVVLRRPGNVAVRVADRPGWEFLAPWEKAGPKLDTADKLQEVRVEQIVQADLTPLALAFDVHVVRRLVPANIPDGTLGQVLPALAQPVLRMIVHEYTDDILRSLFAAEPAGTYDQRQHERIERRLSNLLQDRLRPIGVSVTELWMVARPIAGLYEALSQAAQQRLSIGLEGQRLDTLLNALSDRSEPARSLALLELARALGAGGNKWISLDIEAWMRQAAAGGTTQPGGSSVPGAAGLPPSQTPGWSVPLPIQ